MSKMYYAENPDAAHDIHELRVDLLGEKMTFLTDAGVFSKKMVDFGSQLLLKCLEVNQGETVLDVGLEIVASTLFRSAFCRAKSKARLLMSTMVA